MANKKKEVCLHKTKEAKEVTIKGIKYNQQICKSCKQVLQSRALIKESEEA